MAGVTGTLTKSQGKSGKKARGGDASWPRLSFSELAPGQRFTSHRRTLTETDHQLFMMLTGDWSPIHADAEHARASKLGQRILHGGLGLALALGLQTSALEFADQRLGPMGISV